MRNRARGSQATGQPPGNPRHGDQWTQDLGGQRWRYEFNALSVYPNKWEFIGGPPVVVGPQGSVSTSGATFVDITSGPSIVVARAGVYQVDWGLSQNNPGTIAGAYAANAQLIAIPSNVTGYIGQGTGSSAWWSGDIVKSQLRSLNAGEQVKIQVNTNSTQAHSFFGAWIKVTPVRVS